MTMQRRMGAVHRRVDHVMGMPVSLGLRGRHAEGAAATDAWRCVMEDLHDVDRVFSTYRDDSYVSRLGRNELTVAECPVEVAEILTLAREAEEQSEGAFSVTLPGPDGRRRPDPSGVVKGWAVERASRHLALLPETDFCLSAGGDLACHTADPDRPAWRIGVEHPHRPNTLVAVVPVRSGAVATSGTARRGAHIVDPRTGRTPDGIASVTVVGPSLTWADIDATAAFVHGPDAARWLQSRPIRAALVVWADGTTVRVTGP